METRDKKTELLVGLFLFVGLILLGLLILQFGSIREHFKGTYIITVPLSDASGIRKGSPVILGGSKIGKVAETPVLNAEFNGVIIRLDIYNDKKIPADAKFGLGTAGLLGDAFIEIKTTGKPLKQYLAPDTVVPKENIAPAGGLNALQEGAKDIGKKVDETLVDLRGAIADLRTGIKRLNEGILSDQAMTDLKGTMSHLNKVMTRLDEKTFGEGTSGDIKDAISSVKGAAHTIDEQTKRLGPIFDKLGPAVEKVEKVVTDADKAMESADAAMKSLNKSVTSFGDVAKEARHGSGLLPTLISDAELKNDFKLLISNLRHRGLLFYSDKAGEEQEKREERSRTRPPLTGTRPHG